MKFQNIFFDDATRYRIRTSINDALFISRSKRFVSEWKNSLHKTSFNIVGLERTGKTFVFVNAAWETSRFRKTIAVCRRGDGYITGKWNCTARLPFSPEGLLSLETIVKTEKDYSVLVEFEVFNRNRTYEAIIAELRSLSPTLAAIVCRTQTPLRLILDAFDFYASPVLAGVEMQNPLVCPIYVFQCVEMLEGTKTPIPDVRGYLFTCLSHWRHNKELAAKILCNRRLVEKLVSETGFACAVDGQVFPVYKEPRLLTFIAKGAARLNKSWT